MLRVSPGFFFGVGGGLIWIAVALVLLLLVVAVAQTNHAGQVMTTRTWIRFESWWWDADFFGRGRAVPRHIGARLSQLGIVRPVRVELEPGASMWLDPGDLISRTLLGSRTGEWEAQVWNAIRDGLEDGSVFLDVGAHIGYDTLKAAHHIGPTGRVVAFEPNPRIVQLLRDNVAASGAANVMVQAIACSDTETTLTLFDSTGSNSGGTSLAEANAGPASRAVTVPARRLDDVIQELGLSRVDVIKVDAEGAETLVLRGAQETLRRFKPRLVIEVIPSVLAGMGTSVDELEALIWSLGYVSSRQLDARNREYRASR
jgi:FkbM family methyltransferase